MKRIWTVPTWDFTRRPSMHSIYLCELLFPMILGNNCARDKQEAVESCYCFPSILKSKLVLIERKFSFWCVFLERLCNGCQHDLWWIQLRGGLITAGAIKSTHVWLTLSKTSPQLGKSTLLFGGTHWFCPHLYSKSVKCCKMTLLGIVDLMFCD